MNQRSKDWEPGAADDSKRPRPGYRRGPIYRARHPLFSDFRETSPQRRIESGFEHDGFAVLQHDQRELNVLARGVDVDESMAWRASRFELT